MFLKPFCRYETGCAAYVLGCATCAKCAENAADLYRNIHEKLLSLPETLELYPAHFAGSACGAGMSGKPSSTIAFEKRWNPALSLPEEQFVATIGAGIPPKPAAMDAIVRFNQGRAA